MGWGALTPIAAHGEDESQCGQKETCKDCDMMQTGLSLHQWEDTVQATPLLYAHGRVAMWDTKHLDTVLGLLHGYLPCCTSRESQRCTKGDRVPVVSLAADRVKAGWHKIANMKCHQ